MTGEYVTAGTVVYVVLLALGGSVVAAAVLCPGSSGTAAAGSTVVSRLPSLQVKVTVVYIVCVDVDVRVCVSDTEDGGGDAKNVVAAGRAVAPESGSAEELAAAATKDDDVGSVEELEAAAVKEDDDVESALAGSVLELVPAADVVDAVTEMEPEAALMLGEK